MRYILPEIVLIALLIVGVWYGRRVVRRNRQLERENRELEEQRDILVQAELDKPREPRPRDPQ
jgi:hypothetical protein